MKALVQCGAEVVALSRTEADLLSLKQEVHVHRLTCSMLLNVFFHCASPPAYPSGSCMADNSITQRFSLA